MDSIPCLDKLNRAAWLQFLNELDVYRARGGSRSLRDLITPAVLQLLVTRLDYTSKRFGRELRPIRAMEDADLVEAVGHLFQPASVIEAMDLLQAVTMGPKLSVDAVYAYVMQFNRVRAQCGSVLPLPSWVTKTFIKGLRPQRLLDRVKCRAPETADQAAMYAVDEAEGLVAIMREARMVSSAVVVDAPSPSSAPVRPHHRLEMQPAPGPPPMPKAAESSQGPCFACGQLGHRKRDCPTQRDGSGGQKPPDPPRWSRESGGALRRDPKPSVRTPPGMAKGKVAVDGEVDEGKLADGSERDGLRRMEVLLKGSDGAVSAHALLDSGATREFISQGMYERLLEVGVSTKKTNTAIRQLSGVCVPNIELMLSMQVASAQLGHSVQINIRPLVVDGLDEDIIISMPTLEKTGLIVLLTGDKPVVAAEFEAVPEEDHEGGTQVGDGVLPSVAGAEDEEALGALLNEFADVFGPLPREGADVEPMLLTLKEGLVPRYIPPRRMSPAMQAVVSEEIESLLQQGIIQPSSSQVSSPVVLVSKRDGGYRMCIDYRELNSCTVELRYPIESTRAVLERLARKRVFGKMDLRSGFHQLLLEESSRPLTAFSVKEGLFEFCRVQFGLKNGPTHFQQAMVSVLAGLVGHACEVFIDDIAVYGEDFAQFMENLRLVLTRLRERRLRVKGSKCSLGQKSIEYLGHIVSGEGVQLSDTRRQGIADVKEPKSVSQLRSFLGMATYFRPFIKDFATLAKPLHAMCSEKKPFVWTQPAQLSFDALKVAILGAPLLHFLDYDQPIVVRTDASCIGVGGVLLQRVDGEERAVCFVSRAFNEQESRWSTLEHEAYGVFFAVTSFDHYIRGHRFRVETDHRNLVFLHKSTAPKVIRWRLRLQAYAFDVVHIPGQDNQIADALSRCLAGRDLPHGEDIISVHNAVVGHFGVKKTVELLRESGKEWDSMMKDVDDFIKSCPTCQKVRLGQGNMAAAVKTTVVKEPFSVVALDTIGPIPEDAYGFKFIIVLLDCFTRFVELVPAKDVTALEAAQALLTVFGRYGMPKAVRSDNGSQFTAQVVSNLLHLMGVGREYTIPYRPQSNGLVERSIKEVLRHLRAMIMDQRSGETWSLLLPLVQRVINSTPHTTTGVAPIRLVYGDAVTPNRCMFLDEGGEGDDEPEEQSSVEDYVQRLNASSKRLILASQQHQERVISEYLATCPEDPTEFEVGKYVLVSYPERPPSKLHPVWQGPVVVVAKNGVKYDVQDLSTMEIKSVHVTRLKAYNPAQTDDPRSVAAADTSEYVVDSIVDHRRVNEEWTFRVRWSGYGPSDDTWLKRADLRDVSQFRAYLLAHPELHL